LQRCERWLTPSVGGVGRWGCVLEHTQV
jgi:hypothetical protein